MKRRLLVLTLPVLLVLFGLAIGNIPDAKAATTAPFAVRYATNASGAIVTIGNTLQTCNPAISQCVAALNGGLYDNNYFYMRNLDADSDANTFNSSSSDLALPDGANVLWAGLYWGARLDTATGGSAGNSALANKVMLATPTSTYQEITGSLIAQNPAQHNAYQGFAVVTDLVRTGGNGTYWGANVQAGTGVDRYAGWALTVVYSAPGYPLRNLTVFDGFNTVGAGAPQNIKISGFTTPLDGAVDVQLSMVAYEGDLAQTGDFTRLNNTQLATTISPGTNFFDSVIGLNGASVTTRNPSPVNQLGFDIKNLGASGTIANGQTEAEFHFESAGDVYYPGMLALAINLYAPDFTSSTKTAVNLSGVGDARPGDTLQYTLTYTNTGQDPSKQTSVCDTLPAEVSYISGSLRLLTTPDTGVTTPMVLPEDGSSFAKYDSTNHTICANLGRGAGPYNTPDSGGIIEVNDSTTLEFSVLIKDEAGGKTLTNTTELGYLTGTTGIAGSYQTPPVHTPVVLEADVAIDKQMTPNPAISGQAGQTVLTITNNGPNTATAVKVTDVMPAQYTASSITVELQPDGGSPAPGPSCALPVNSDPLTCSLGDINVGDKVVITIAGQPDADGQSTSLSNVARVETTSYDPDLSNNVDTVSIPMTQQADVKITKITKSASPNHAPAGSRITYQLTATNLGYSTARDVVISDTVPDPNKLVLLKVTGDKGVLGDVSVTCPASLTSTTTVTCQVDGGLLQVGQTAVVTVDAYIRAGVTAGTTVNNEAAVAASTYDPQQDNNLARAGVLVDSPIADLGIIKTASPASVVAGQQLSYTITVTNYGPSDAVGVVLSDALPAGIDSTALKVTSDRGVCTALPCTIGNLPGPDSPGAVGGSVNVTLSGLVVRPGYPDNGLDNTATVTATGQGASQDPDPDPHPNWSTASVPVLHIADVAVTKTSARSVLPVDNVDTYVDYTVTITNYGPSATQGTTLTDTLPTGFSLLRVTDATTGAEFCSLTGVGQTFSCELGHLTVGQSRVVKLETLAPASHGQWAVPLTQTAKANSTDPALPDPNPFNNEATWDLSGAPQADLALVKTSSGDFIAGNGVTTCPGCATATPVVYQLEVKNLGPNAAAAGEITDTLPEGVSFDSGSGTAGTCSVSGTTPEGLQIVTCPTPAIDANGQYTASIQVKLSADLADKTVLRNTAVVSTPTAETTLGNNTSTTVDTVRSIPDLVIDVFDIQQCDSRVIGSDPCDSTYDGPASDRTVYMHFTNLGLSTAKNVVLRSNVAVTSSLHSDDLPGFCSVVNQELVCNLDSSPQLANGFEPGLGLTLGFSFTVASFDTPGYYAPCSPAAYELGSRCSNPGGWAEISTSDNESTLANNGLTAPLTIGTPVTALKVVKNVQVDTDVTNPDGHPFFVAGGTFAYNIQVSVADDVADAENVTLSDVLPDGLHVTQANTSKGDCDIDGTGGAQTDNRVTCDLGTLRGMGTATGTPSQIVTLTIFGTVDSDLEAEITAGSGLHNTVTVKSTTLDASGGPATASDSAEADVIKLADLELSKLADSEVAYAGANVGYTLTVINNGPSDVDDAEITDTLPLGLTLNTAQSPACTTTVPGTTTTGEKIRCVPAQSGQLPGTIYANQNGSVRVVADTQPRDLRPTWCTGQDNIQGVTCPEVLPPADLHLVYPRAITNTAKVGSPTAIDAKPINNTATVTTKLDMLADIAITSAVSTDTPSAGSDLTYTLNAVNAGPSTADSPVLEAVFPAGFVIKSFSTPYMICTTSSTGSGLSVVYTLRCTGYTFTPIDDTFPPGYSVPGTVVVSVPAQTPPGPYTATAHIYSVKDVQCPNPAAGTCESDYSNNTTQQTVNVVAVADTQIEKTLVEPNPIQAGANVTYKLTIKNNGPSVAGSATVSDTVPDGMTYVSGQVVDGDTCPAPSFMDGHDVLTCPLGDLAPDDTAVVVATFKVSAAWTGEICNTGSIGSGVLDPNSNNNASEYCGVTVPPPATDVAVDITADQADVTSGTPISYRAVVTNRGPLATTGAKVTFTLPSGLTSPVVEMTDSSGGANPDPTCSLSGSSAICLIGDMPVYSTATYRISGVAAGTGGADIKVTAVVTHAIMDTDPSDDQAEADIFIKGSIAQTGATALVWALALAVLLTAAGLTLVALRRRKQNA
jgi:uncharacterized repeat protein (TIGR01451 family)/fimbrial isopeptide formation D2 family protein